MKMKTLIRSVLKLPLILAVVVLTGLVFLRRDSDSPAPAKVEIPAQHKVQPSQADTTTPSPHLLAQAAAGKSSASTASSAPLWAAPNETLGEKLDPKSAAYLKAQQAGVRPKGRSALLDRGSMTSLAIFYRPLSSSDVADRCNSISQIHTESSSGNRQYR